MHERFIARQPIFDQRLKVFAYELCRTAKCLQGGQGAFSNVIVASTTIFDLEMLAGHMRLKRFRGAALDLDTPVSGTVGFPPQ